MVKENFWLYSTANSGGGQVHSLVFCSHLSFQALKIVVIITENSGSLQVYTHSPNIKMVHKCISFSVSTHTPAFAVNRMYCFRCTQNVFAICVLKLKKYSHSCTGGIRMHTKTSKCERFWIFFFTSTWNYSNFTFDNTNYLYQLFVKLMSCIPWLIFMCQMTIVFWTDRWKKRCKRSSDCTNTFFSDDFSVYRLDRGLQHCLV